MPNRDELRSIVDKSGFNPSIDTTYFPNTNSSVYWSSTEYATGYKRMAWFFYTTNGYQTPDSKDCIGLSAIAVMDGMATPL